MHCHRKGIDYHLERILSSISPSLFLSGLISLLHSANIFAPLVSVFSFVYLLGQGDPTCYNFLLWLQLTRPDWSRIEETEVFVDFVELSTLQIFFPFLSIDSNHISYFLYHRRDSQVGFGDHLLLVVFFHLSVT
jgi:hypothetical protein